MKISRISASRLDIFENCPFQYKLKYHDGIEVPVESPYAQFGSWIHKGLELHIRDGTPIREALKSCIQEYKFGIDMLDKVPIILRNFDRVNRKLPAGKTEFEFNIETPVKVPINGIIDRLISEGNKILIIDYKTGKQQKTPTQLKTNPQMLMYAYAAHEVTKTPYAQINLNLFYLLTGDLVGVKFTEPEITKFLGFLWGKVEEIQSMDPADAKAKPSRNCMYCDFRGHCTQGQAFCKLRGLIR